MAYVKICFLGLALIGLTAAAAHAQATIGDCEKIQAADAYNQCLAKFGPTSKVKSLEPERPGDVKGSSEEAAAGAGRAKVATRAAAKAGRARRGRGSHVARHGGGRGRKRVVISVGRRR